MNFSAVILAGGKSSRMGRDKARLIVDGQSLLARQIQIVQSLGAAEVFISGRAGEDYLEFGLPVLHDRFPDAGPLGGIERALKTARSPLLLVLAVDMPHMTADTLGRLKNICTGDRGVVPRFGGQVEPLAAIYPKSAHRLAETLLAGGDNAVRHFAEQCVEKGLALFHEMPVINAICFANWNSPVDLPCP